MSKVGSGMDREIAADQYDVADFEENMRRYRPRAVAFTRKRAAAVWLGKTSTSEIYSGRQIVQPPDFPKVFVLTSPSGAVSGHWEIEPWRELARWLRP
jgi:TDG/mug DNA glycosylase family protein